MLRALNHCNSLILSTTPELSTVGVALCDYPSFLEKTGLGRLKGNDVSCWVQYMKTEPDCPGSNPSSVFY